MLRAVSSAVAGHIAAPAVAAYILAQRRRLAITAQPLPDPLQARLAGYFDAEDLDRAQWVYCDPLPLPQSPLPGRIDRSLVAAVTLDNVIAAREPLTPHLAFHEMVHVVQYRLLGVYEFSRLYVEGFLWSGSYHGIPLENCAFELEARYARGAEFSVDLEVRNWLANKKKGGAGFKRKHSGVRHDRA